MRVVSSDSGSVTVANTEYTDETESAETSDHTEFWRGDPSVRRLAAVPSGGRWRWCAGIAGSVAALMLLLLIITVSVNHVKFNRKFSATELRIQNLTQIILNVISRTQELEQFGHKINADVSSLEFDQRMTETSMNNLLESAQALHDKVSELKCHIDKMRNNNTQELCCPDQWSLFSSNCYFFSTDGMSWDSARDECERKRAKLLILTSKLEKSFVVSKTKPLFYWLGLTDGRTGEWEWLDETPYEMVRSEWRPGQPDNWKAHGLGGGEDCAHFHHDGRYNDDHCSRHYRYICKAAASAI